MRSALGLVRACHPEPTAAVTLAAMALAVASGRDWLGVAAVGLAIVTGQLSVGWLNDYLDADRDRAAGRGDKPIPAGTVSRRVVGVATAVAAVACVPASFLSGVPAGVAHAAAVVSAWTYNAGLKATPLSVLPYAVSFGLLPAFVVLGLPGHPAPAPWLIAAGALLGAGAHFANVLPDLEADEAAGIRGLPHRIGVRAAEITAALLLLAASAVLAFGPAGRLGWLAWSAPAAALAVLSAGYALGRRPGSRAVFRAVLVVAVIDVLMLVGSGTVVR
ncbi:MAG TPA: UbiA family prenyltransferase [Pseudonocardiaceae bacterium]|nr:UbiA family prenyltransferase [Pseudonocardiaceae bacterium]